MDDEHAISGGQRTVGMIADELGMPVADVVAVLQRIGVRCGDASACFTPGHAAQLVYFVRKLLGYAEQVSAAGVLSPARPIADVLNGPASDLMRLDGVRGVGIGEDLYGRAFLRVYTSAPADDVEGLPAAIEGYALIAEPMGAVRAA